MEESDTLQETWRKRFLYICFWFAVICTVAELIVFAIEYSTNSLGFPLNEYRIRFIYVPVILNFGWVTIVAEIEYRSHLKTQSKNKWVCFLPLVICCNVMVIHYMYAPLLCLPCIAIFSSVAFADVDITTDVSAAGVISELIAALLAKFELRSDDPQLVYDVAFALVALIGSYIVARLLIWFISEHIDSIKKSNLREKQLIHELQIDPLTGMYNRIAMKKAINQLVDRYDGSYTMNLVMIDLDMFKSINDTYGHIYGDEVLMRISSIIKKRGRKDLISCRYGGEEILLIIKDKTLQEATQLVYEMLVEFRNEKYDFNPSNPITFSAGICPYVEGLTAYEWVDLSDKYLYEAKNAGRNRICFNGQMIA